MSSLTILEPKPQSQPKRQPQPAEHTCQNRQLLIDSRQFAEESPLTSWLHLSSTLAVTALLLGAISLNEGWLFRAACSLILALVLVRMFILYHDFLHSAIFRKSPVAGAILRGYGYLMLTPPGVWKQAHDHHHQHNCRFLGISIGSFPVMTKEGYLTASRQERLEYRIARNPLVIVFGYFTVFLYGMCLYPLAVGFRKNIESLFSLLIHFGTLGIVGYFLGLEYAFFAIVLPTFIATLVGTYLFYVQHNFPEATVHDEDEWTYANAALLSSSHLRTGVVLNWFLGNIGLHHVHHLNAKIPFYRLPEAMAQLPGLQQPGTTSFALKDIAACLKLKLWDTERNCFVPFP